MSFLNKLAAGVEGFAGGIQAGQSLGYNIAGGPAQELQRKKEREEADRKRREINDAYTLFQYDPTGAVGKLDELGYSAEANALRNRISQTTDSALAGITQTPTLVAPTIETARTQRQTLGEEISSLEKFTLENKDELTPEQVAAVDARKRDLSARQEYMASLANALSATKVTRSWPAYEVKLAEVEQRLINANFNEDEIAAVKLRLTDEFNRRKENDILNLMQQGASVSGVEYVPPHLRARFEEYERDYRSGRTTADLQNIMTIRNEVEYLPFSVPLEPVIRKLAAQYNLSEEQINSLIVSETVNRERNLSDAEMAVTNIVDNAIKKDRELLLNSEEPFHLIQLGKDNGVTIEYTYDKTKDRNLPTPASMSRLFLALKANRGIITAADSKERLKILNEKASTVSLIDSAADDYLKKIRIGDGKEEQYRREFTATLVAMLQDEKLTPEERAVINKYNNTFGLGLYTGGLETKPENMTAPVNIAGGQDTSKGMTSTPFLAGALGGVIGRNPNKQQSVTKTGTGRNAAPTITNP